MFDSKAKKKKDAIQTDLKHIHNNNNIFSSLEWIGKLIRNQLIIRT